MKRKPTPMTTPYQPSSQQWLQYSTTIWGPGAYEFEVQKDLFGTYWAYVQRDIGQTYPEVLMASKMNCRGPRVAEMDLLRKLEYLAGSVERQREEEMNADREKKVGS